MSRVTKIRARTYRDFLPRTGPASMQGPNGLILWGETGGNIDEHLDDQKDGAKARFPEFAPTDALAEIGKDSGFLERGPTEVDAAYGTRLKGRWDTWEQSGKHKGLLVELKVQEFPSGVTGVRIVQHNGLSAYIDGSNDVVLGSLTEVTNRIALDGSVPGNLDGWVFECEGPASTDVNGRVRDQFFSQFGLLFVTDVPTLREGTVDQSRINTIVEKWRPGKAVFRGTWVIESGTVLGFPEGRTLGDGHSLAATVRHFITAPHSISPMT